MKALEKYASKKRLAAILHDALTQGAGGAATGAAGGLSGVATKRAVGRLFGDAATTPLKEEIKRNMAGGAIAGGIGGLITGTIKGSTRSLKKPVLTEAQRNLLLASGLGLGGGMLAGKLSKKE